MRSGFLVLCIVTITTTVTFSMASQNNQSENDPQLAHIVFFALKDDSSDAAKKLVAECNKYLSGHDGTVYYSAGTRATEFQREVNDRQYDVALHVVFENKAQHDKYQEHARHLKFIEDNKDNWASVRVFDSYLAVD